MGSRPRWDGCRPRGERDERARERIEQSVDIHEALHVGAAQVKDSIHKPVIIVMGNALAL
jgi:hypothetical protein